MSSQPAYHAVAAVVEPHPSSTGFHGRGGAGNVNVTNPKPTTTTSSPSTTTTTTTALTTYLPKPHHSGRGGAGNTHPARERAIFSFDEELARQLRHESGGVVAPVYRVGRGGAGNVVYDGGADRRSSATRTGGRSEAGSVTSSDGSATEEGMAERARRSLEKGWGRLVGH